MKIYLKNNSFCLKKRGRTTCIFNSFQVKHLAKVNFVKLDFYYNITTLVIRTKLLEKTFLNKSIQIKSEVIGVFAICDRDEQSKKITMYCLIFIGFGVYFLKSNFRINLLQK